MFGWVGKNGGKFYMNELHVLHAHVHMQHGAHSWKPPPPFLPPQPNIPLVIPLVVKFWFLYECVLSTFVLFNSIPIKFLFLSTKIVAIVFGLELLKDSFYCLAPKLALTSCAPPITHGHMLNTEQFCEFELVVILFTHNNIRKEKQPICYRSTKSSNCFRFISSKISDPGPPDFQQHQGCCHHYGHKFVI